ncbi:DNA translocase FtsK [Wenxinia saemankumensis]|uniref:DNA translocase FtsK n=1 Tax=Wenxinia saemankumensis TaxID=1447782 RepID=A0A1M6FW03_9RHOB|nr:DNA translocase FtsK [Wenxinia saemankumensis]SHJ01780.1 DNA segregation ATPase FtsK/SpoIIIE, S-DNA-T family [Wenxinia saemankumensis]
MAYQTRGRDPLLDSSMQAAIEKRGKELIGLALIAAGLAVAAMMWSYTPDDPNWLLASDAPVQNWLGRFGASLSHPLVMIVGKATWAIPLILVVWGLRFAAHRGEDRALSRVLVAPIAVAATAIYAATLTPGASWSQSFGLGGLFGDTVLSIVLTVLPLGGWVGSLLLGLVALAGTALALAFALGFTTRELNLALRWAIYGVIVAYDLALRAAGRTGDVGLHVARGVQGRVSERMAAKREEAAAQRARIEAEAAAERLVPGPGARSRHAEADEPAPPPASRLSGRAAAIIRPATSRMPEPDPQPDWSDDVIDAGDGRAEAEWPRPAPGFLAAPARDASPRPARAERAAEGRVQPPVTGERKMPPMPGFGAGSDPAQAGPASLAAPLAAPKRAEARPPRAEPAPRRFLGGLFARSESAAEPEMPEIDEDSDGAPDDRIKSRIADAIRARRAAVEAPVAPPPKVRPKGPRPLILDTTRKPRAEPPVAAMGTGAGPAIAGAAAALATPAGAALRAEPPVLAGSRRPEPTLPRAIPAAPDSFDAFGSDWQEAAAEWPVETTLDAAEVAAPAPLRAPARDPAPQPALTRGARAEEESPGLTAEPLFDPEAPARAAPAEARKAVVHTPSTRKPQPSTRARAEAEPALPFDDRYPGYEPPPLNLLADPADITRHHLSNEALEENARMLESVLDDYGVKGEIVSVRPGPVVTMYELEPAPGLKASRVIGLADDIARSMSALSARVSTVPGRSVIGIELPNANREKVVLREILSARDFGDSQQKLPLALGKDIAGEPIVANLAKMPHLLIAGTTGSGKSVAINTMILSLLYRLTPEECRLIMIDPKMLELSVYDGIPHLLSPVVTDPKKAVVALKWVVGEMEERYRKMSKMGVRNIDGYNGRVKEAQARGECFERTVQTGFDEETGDPIFETEEIQPEAMPYIVVIVDEMADLMMVAGKEIEACIQRLAQMARASGIHLIMATQRPSVDVITGTIKANFPTRISFQVTSKIDSRTILGEQGAEQLLGMGDMLYMAGGGRVNRVHGPFCSDEEVEEIVSYLKGFGPPEYVSGVVEGPAEDKESDIDAVLGLGGEGKEGDEALYDQAVHIVAKDRKCSTSYIQRKLGIGYNKAARLVEQMEDEGVVSASNHVGKREVLVPEVQ